MTLLSAYEDFCTRTLSTLNGAWNRLEFVSGLKGKKGQYEHWGMEYTYGRAQANRALAQAHTELFQKVLETPIPELAGELEEAVRKDSGIAAEKYLPEQLNGCSKDHFQYISVAINLLAESRSSRQVA